MNHIKYLKSAVKIVLFVAIVIAIEHTVYFSLEWYRSLPMPCERTETFENFIFIVSPKADGEVSDLSSDQFLLARIKTSELAGQKCEDVLKNHSGPIEIIGDSDSGEYSIKTDISLFEIKTISDLKNKLKNEGYIKGEDLFPELNKPIGASLDSFPLSFPAEEEKYGYKLFFLYYNDKYIRLCSPSTRDDAKLNYDYIYTVDNNRINMVRNICKIYSDK